MVPVIMDIVDSRRLTNREVAQRDIENACTTIEEHVQALQPWQATMGDEFQAVYASLPEALRATALLRLKLPEGIDCRFGIGQGNIKTVGSRSVASIQDGSGWWAARSAIEQARQREKSKSPTLRTWFQDAADSPSTKINAAITNSYLLSRDQLLTSLSAKTRRYVSGLSLGSTQAQVASALGVTQSAVSQALKNSGAGTILASLDLLESISLQNP